MHGQAWVQQQEGSHDYRWRDSEVQQEEGEEQWPANPWQAQADAHIMQLRQSGAVFHHIQQEGGAESCLARLNGAALVVGSSPPDVRHMGLHGQSLASAGGLNAVPGGMALAPDLQAQTVRDLSLCVNDLEGQVAFLEDAALRRERELEDSHARLRLVESRQQVEGHSCISTSALDAEDLQRKNAFLSVVVSRFERKAMDLEKEIVTLTVEKQAAELRAQWASEQFASKSVSVASCRPSPVEADPSISDQTATGGRPVRYEGTALADMEAQTDDELLVQIRELEGQVALLQDASTRKEHELSATGLRAEVEAARAEASEHCERHLELKELNAQLIDRLGKERKDNAQTRQSLEVVSTENGSMSFRLDRLSEQLYELVTVNESLQKELAAAKLAIFQSAARRHLDPELEPPVGTAGKFDSLNSMS